MSTLSQYLLVLRNLIQSPTAPVPLLSDALLTVYINLGRKQVAIDAECIRGTAAATVGSGVVAIPITALSAPGFTSILGQAIVVRNARLGGNPVDIRPWDWFQNYWLSGQPSSVLPEAVMAHQGQGQYANLYVYSQAGGQLEADVVFLPVDLADDTTPDAVPYPFSDAVPFYAGWYAYMAMQRQADAQMAYSRYVEVLRRGRTTITSTALPENDPGGVGALLATTRGVLGAPLPAQQQGGR